MNALNLSLNIIDRHKRDKIVKQAGGIVFVHQTYQLNPLAKSLLYKHILSEKPKFVAQYDTKFANVAECSINGWSVYAMRFHDDFRPGQYQVNVRCDNNYLCDNLFEGARGKKLYEHMVQHLK